MKSIYFDLAENETTVLFLCKVIVQCLFLLFQAGRQHYDLVGLCLIIHILEQRGFFPLVRAFLITRECSLCSALRIFNIPAWKAN